MNDSSNYPWAYSQGYVDFFGSRIICDERALIPRFESESLVREAARYLETIPPHPLTLWDIGCGSGTLGISLTRALREKNTHSVDLILSDISRDALDLSRINIDLHKLTEVTSFMCTSLASSFPGNLDTNSHLCVLANLPYIRADERSIMSEDTIYEPEIALFGTSEDGLGLYRDIMIQFEDIQNKYPQLFIDIFFEYGHSQQAEFLKGLSNKWDYKSFSDLSGTSRFIQVSSRGMSLHTSSMTDFTNLSLTHIWNKPQAKSALIYHSVLSSITKIHPEIHPKSIAEKEGQIIISVHNPLKSLLIKECEESILADLESLYSKFGEKNQSPKKIALR